MMHLIILVFGLQANDIDNFNLNDGAATTTTATSMPLEAIAIAPDGVLVNMQEHAPDAGKGTSFAQASELTMGALGQAGNNLRVGMGATPVEIEMKAGSKLNSGGSDGMGPADLGDEESDSQKNGWYCTTMIHDGSFTSYIIGGEGPCQRDAPAGGGGVEWQIKLKPKGIYLYEITFTGDDTDCVVTRGLPWTRTDGRQATTSTLHDGIFIIFKTPACKATPTGLKLSEVLNAHHCTSQAGRAGGSSTAVTFESPTSMKVSAASEGFVTGYMKTQAHVGEFPCGCGGQADDQNSWDSVCFSNMACDNGECVDMPP